ncbi:MAG: SDR family oxidoreductase [Candidatus Pacearchaeota archaeon]
MTKMRGVLIFGASGTIGSYIYDLLKKNKYKVIGTYNKNPKDELIFFDLRKSSIKELNLNGINYAVICSALTKLDKINENPEISYEVNVRGTIRIIKELEENSIKPIFFSSASVFDGEKGGYKEEDERKPISIYGKQKVEVEDFIIKNIKEYIIIRPGKVFGYRKGEGVLFSEWLEKYYKNEEIKLADDEMLSPTFAGDIARGVKIIIEKNLNGIYHINYPFYYSRYEMCKKFFKKIGIRDAKITRCSIKDFNFLEKRMMKSYLDTSKFLKETRFKYTNIEDCFEKIKENITR